MSANHKPATPLPWAACKTNTGRSFVMTRADDSDGDIESPDAAYIAHAANAYPRLVEALRDASEILEMLGAACPDRVWDGEKDQPVTAKGARALLRELGEDA